MLLALRSDSQTSHCNKQAYLTKPHPFILYKGREFFMSELAVSLLKKGELGKPDGVEFE